MALSALFLAGVSSVPFHPDEATQIYMSADVETLFTDPLSLAWQPGAETDPRALYRLLDAPLARMLIGVGRALAGQPALPVDWNWSETWSLNAARGALPAHDLLLASRYALAWLFPLTLLLVYFTVRALGGGWTGLAAMLLFGTNALVLLHTRRAMAEAGLVFAVALTLFGLTQARRRPWIAALGAALAFCAKQSAIALVPAALLAVVWYAAQSRWPWRAALARLALSAGIFTLVTLLLNPFLWKHPIGAVQAAVTARAGLVERQVAAIGGVDESQILDTPAERTAALLAHLFIVPPAIEDVGNYRAELAQEGQAYLANPLHRLDRGLIAGGLLLALALFGGIGLALKVVRQKRGEGFLPALLLLAFALQAATLIAAVPLPFQRYWMPLAPFTSLLSAYGLAAISNGVLLAMRRRKRGGNA